MFGGKFFTFASMTLGCKSSPYHFESLLGCPIAALCVERWRACNLASLTALAKWVDDFIFRIAATVGRPLVPDAKLAWSCLSDSITAVSASCEPSKTTRPWL